MPAANPPSSRVFVRFAQDQYDQFQEWSKQLGVPLTHLVAMCAWTGSHILIPRMLPDKHRQLEMLIEQEQQEMYAAQADAHFEAMRLDSEVFEQFNEHREEFEQWRKERGLHNNEK